MEYVYFQCFKGPRATRQKILANFAMGSITIPWHEPNWFGIFQTRSSQSLLNFLWRVFSSIFFKSVNILKKTPESADNFINNYECSNRIATKWLFSSEPSNELFKFWAMKWIFFRMAWTARWSKSCFHRQDTWKTLDHDRVTVGH